MRLVLLAGTRPEQRYVADRLSSAFGEDLRAILIAEPGLLARFVAQAR